MAIDRPTKVFTGSKGSLRIDGRKVAFVGSITVNEENTLTDIDVLDQLEVAEHAETAHKVSFSCNLFKIDENSISGLGYSFTDDIRTLLTQPELEMDIYDSVSEKIVYGISGVKFEGGSGSLDARGVWQGTWNFKGRRRSTGSL